MRVASCSSITATPVRNLDTPMIGRDIMTYLLDRDRALKSLAEVEPTWGGDIRTRMAATAEAQGAIRAHPAAIATKTDADRPSDAPRGRQRPPTWPTPPGGARHQTRQAATAGRRFGIATEPPSSE